MTRSSEFLNCEPTVYKLGSFHVVDYCGHDGICVGHAYHVCGTAKDAITMMRRINNEFHYSDSSVRSCLALLTGSIKYVSADEVCGKLIVKENSNGSSTINQEMNTLQIAKGYGVEDFLKDIGKILMRSGMSDKKQAFLLSDIHKSPCLGCSGGVSCYSGLCIFLQLWRLGPPALVCFGPRKTIHQ